MYNLQYNVAIFDLVFLSTSGLFNKLDCQSGLGKTWLRKGQLQDSYKLERILF